MELTGKINALDFSTGKTLLTLEIKEKEATRKTYEDFKDCDKLAIKITKHRKKRSLNANNYAWKLITKIAELHEITKEEVYKQYIRDIGVCKQIEINEKAVDTLIHSWQLHGLGWLAERLDYGENEGFVLINLYYGSSVYNTQQMSRLINNIVQDCNALGIQTKTPEEIANMLSLWKAGEQ